MFYHPFWNIISMDTISINCIQFRSLWAVLHLSLARLINFRPCCRSDFDLAIFNWFDVEMKCQLTFWRERDGCVWFYFLDPPPGREALRIFWLGRNAGWSYCSRCKRRLSPVWRTGMPVLSAPLVPLKDRHKRHWHIWMRKNYDHQT